MAKATSTRNCPRQLQTREIARSCAGFDPVESTLLTLVRFFAESFAMPQTQSWLRSIDYAAHYFGSDKGAVITQRLLFALQAMRETRRSEFNFSTPSCEVCSEIVTEHERRFMAAIRNVRRGRASPMVTELMFLCEGNDTRKLIECINNLCAALPPASSVYSTEQTEH